MSQLMNLSDMRLLVNLGGMRLVMNLRDRMEVINAGYFNCLILSQVELEVIHVVMCIVNLIHRQVEMIALIITENLLKAGVLLFRFAVGQVLLKRVSRVVL